MIVVGVGHFFSEIVGHQNYVYNQSMASFFISSSSSPSSTFNFDLKLKSELQPHAQIQAKKPHRTNQRRSTSSSYANSLNQKQFNCNSILTNFFSSSDGVVWQSSTVVVVVVVVVFVLHHSLKKGPCLRWTIISRLQREFVERRTCGHPLHAGAEAAVGIMSYHGLLMNACKRWNLNSRFSTTTYTQKLWLTFCGLINCP